MKQSNQFLQAESQRYALIGALFGLLFPIIATLLRIAESGLPLNFDSTIKVQFSDKLLWIIDTAPFFLGYFASIAGRRQDISQKLNTELRQRETELEQARTVLEQRIAERTAALERRANQLQAVSMVANTIASIQDMDLLLPEITNLVSDRFGFYHAGIFLLDEKNEYAILRAANSAGGKNMLSRQHKLKLDMNSIVGYVTSRGEPRIALDVGADAVFFNNPDLPDTRSEIALPLRVGGRVIGALDVQSTESNAFTEEDVNVASILADQVAIAIENARLFREARTALGTSEATFSKYVKQEWSSFASQSKNTGYMFDGTRTTALDNKAKTEKVKTLPQTGRLSLEKETSELTIPIKFRGQTVGILDVKSKKGNRQWTQDEITLLEAAAERAAFALENARLVESAQRRASRERAIGDISTKIGAVSDLEAIMQTTVEELGRKIGGTSEVILELDNPEN
jgi:GAF domain-containing protein